MISNGTPLAASKRPTQSQTPHWLLACRDYQYVVLATKNNSGTNPQSVSTAQACLHCTDAVRSRMKEEWEKS